ncbi:MAG: hypothetical protein RMI56_01590 [Sulfolobales archaeon]|nr:hypothetical protein [Sulfolobales archaeon]MDW8082471.1 hypothetical protein [Sulfolobales archaeon]
MVFPRVTAVLGFNYRLSIYIHTHPVLRYIASVLVAIHGYGGFVLLVNRYVRKPMLKYALFTIALAYVAILIIVPTFIELALTLER